MTEWAARRFWKAASVTQADVGFGVALDGRPIKTPAKTPLIVPTQALADLIASEWDAQDEKIDPTTMPFTRMTNSAIDKVTHQHAAVADAVAAYGDADLLCYRADHPDDLVARQSAAWDPLLDWASETLGARLMPRSGIMHQAQDERALDVLAKRVHAMDSFTLTGFHDSVALSGSLVIGFAVLAGHQPVDVLWKTSRVDELWQEEQWGEDEEAQEMAAVKARDFSNAAQFLGAIRAKTPEFDA